VLYDHFVSSDTLWLLALFYPSASANIFHNICADYHCRRCSSFSDNLMLISFNLLLVFCLFHAVDIAGHQQATEYISCIRCQAEVDIMMVQGCSHDFTLGGYRSWAPKARESRCREGLGLGKGCPLSSPSGVWSGAPAVNAFLAYLRPTEHFSGRENSVILASFLLLKNPLNQRLGAWSSDPLLATPL